MGAATVTSKGQVTIPAEVREQLGIKSGDRLLFQVEGEKSMHVRVIAKKKLADLFGILPATKPFPGVAKIRKEAGRGLGEAPARRS